MNIKTYTCKLCADKEDNCNGNYKQGDYRKYVAYNLYTKNYNGLCYGHFKESITKLKTPKIITYPVGWSFGQTNNVVDPDKLIYRLHIPLYFNTDDLSSCKGIDRYINLMRQGHSIEDIIKGLVDGIVDELNYNHYFSNEVIIEEKYLEPDISFEAQPTIIKTPDVKINSNPLFNKGKQDYFNSMKELAKHLGKSLKTVERWSKNGLVIKDDNGYKLK